MPLGGLNPLPLRLGGNDVDGLTSSQLSRIAADLTAMIRVAPFAVLQFQTNNSNVIAYTGQNGVGLASAPTVGIIGNHSSSFTWDSGYGDEYDVWHSIDLKHAVAEACLQPIVFNAVVTNHRTVTIEGRNWISGANCNANTYGTLVVF